MNEFSSFPLTVADPTNYEEDQSFSIYVAHLITQKLDLCLPFYLYLQKCPVKRLDSFFQVIYKIAYIFFLNLVPIVYTHFIYIYNIMI